MYLGPALYPPLTQMAGLGWLGASGLIITPEHGPRVRLAVVLTNIENLPYLSDYYGCSVCIKVCPFDTVGCEALKERLQPS